MWTAECLDFDMRWVDPTSEIATGPVPNGNVPRSRPKGADGLITGPWNSLLVPASALDVCGDTVNFDKCHRHTGCEHMLNDTTYSRPPKALGWPCGTGFTEVVCEETEGVTDVCDHKLRHPLEGMYFMGTTSIVKLPNDEAVEKAKESPKCNADDAKASIGDSKHI